MSQESEVPAELIADIKKEFHGIAFENANVMILKCECLFVLLFCINIAPTHTHLVASSCSSLSPIVQALNSVPDTIHQPLIWFANSSKLS
jgi:hypothetical protein